MKNNYHGPHRKCGVRSGLPVIAGPAAPGAHTFAMRWRTLAGVGGSAAIVVTGAIGALCTAPARAERAEFAERGRAPAGARAEAPAASLRRDWPCPGCWFQPAPGDAPAPLLVVLHGDAAAGRAPDLRTPFTALQDAARARGLAVLAPRCPAEHGCTRGSFWQWTQGGPSAWLAEQVRAVTSAYRIDAERVSLLGWSGGASYAGSVVHELGERFAAVAFVGGGMPPEPLPPDCPRCLPPAYFLAGDKNPFHHLAQALRGLYTRCGAEARWQPLAGADHEGELAALRSPARVAALLDWLAAKKRRCPAP